jgi:hypothetical protein
VYRAQLAVLPRPNTLQEAHHIGLLLAVEFLDVFVRAHDLLQHKKFEQWYQYQCASITNRASLEHI